MKDEFDYVVKGLPAGQARQLVFLLHGVGLNATVMDKMAQDVLAVLPTAAIIMPHGPEAYNPPPAQEGDLLRPPQIASAIAKDNTARQWFDMSGDIAHVRVKLTAVAQKLNAFIDNKRDLFGLKDKDIASMGFSQGGGLALYTAFLRTTNVGCTVGHSTIFFSEPAFKSAPPTLYLYGTADTEFTMPAYARSIPHLKAHVPTVQIVEISGLQHRTSTESRKIVAEFIRDRLTTPVP